MNSLIMVISVLILYQIPWLIHFQAKPKEIQMNFNLKSLWESQEIQKIWNCKLLLMSLFIIQVQSGSSSSNYSHSGNFDQISFKFKRLEPFLLFIIQILD
jgi:hypothetical protein